MGLGLLKCLLFEEKEQYGQFLVHGMCMSNTVHRVPSTKLGRLMKDGKIKSIEDIYLFSLPKYQIVNFFLARLKDEIMKIMPV